MKQERGNNENSRQGCWPQIPLDGSEVSATQPGKMSGERRKIKRQRRGRWGKSRREGRVGAEQEKRVCDKRRKKSSEKKREKGQRGILRRCRVSFGLWDLCIVLSHTPTHTDTHTRSDSAVKDRLPPRSLRVRQPVPVFGLLWWNERRWGVFYYFITQCMHMHTTHTRHRHLNNSARLCRPSPADWLWPCVFFTFPWGERTRLSVAFPVVTR